MTNTHFVQRDRSAASGALHHRLGPGAAHAGTDQKIPEHYAIYAERSFNFNGIDQPNRNRLLWRDRTVDGVKTGHTEAAGYCLVASALRDNMRLISVVMGTDSEEARMRESAEAAVVRIPLLRDAASLRGGVPLKTARLWYGPEPNVELGAPRTST
jgi:serine-type D-Ala-D-Ala carboxypeptidase (penicillin-binding protein 5/6)